MQPREAYMIASQAFEGAVDRHGLPVIQHSLRVAKDFDGDERVVALLHDIVEDTEISIEDLQAQGLTEVQAKALEAVTRNKNETYREFITRIAWTTGKAGRIARKVKLADLEDNMTRGELPESKEMIAKRYQPAHDRLSVLVEADDEAEYWG